MMTDIMIVGGGGLAKEIKWQIERINAVEKRWNIKGFVDPKFKPGDIFEGVLCYCSDDTLLEIEVPTDVVIAIAEPNIRKKIAKKLKVNKNLRFPSIIDPSVVIAPDVKLGEGCIICINSTLTVNIGIGDFAILNPCCIVGHDSVIKQFATLYPSVNICGNVVVGECAQLGVGSIVIQGKTIGEKAFLGAGAVAVKNIPDKCIAVGVPAVPIRNS